MFFLKGYAYPWILLNKLICDTCIKNLSVMRQTNEIKITTLAVVPRSAPDDSRGALGVAHGKGTRGSTLPPPSAPWVARRGERGEPRTKPAAHRLKSFFFSSRWWVVTGTVCLATAAGRGGDPRSPPIERCDSLFLLALILPELRLQRLPLFDALAARSASASRLLEGH